MIIGQFLNETTLTSLAFLLHSLSMTIPPLCYPIMFPFVSAITFTKLSNHSSTYHTYSSIEFLLTQFWSFGKTLTPRCTQECSDVYLVFSHLLNHQFIDNLILFIGPIHLTTLVVILTNNNFKHLMCT
jgi:hypothetical protein